MCFFEKNDYLFWIELDGFDQKLMLRLRKNFRGTGYNDYFTIERPLGSTLGTETLFTLPFQEIVNITYQTKSPYSTISFDMLTENRFQEIKIARYCFNPWEFRRMIKVFKNSDQSPKV